MKPTSAPSSESPRQTTQPRSPHQRMPSQTKRKPITPPCSRLRSCSRLRPLPQLINPNACDIRATLSQLHRIIHRLRLDDVIPRKRTHPPRQILRTILRNSPTPSKSTLLNLHIRDRLKPRLPSLHYFRSRLLKPTMNIHKLFHITLPVNQHLIYTAYHTL